MIDIGRSVNIPSGFVDLGLSEDIICLMSSKALDFAWAKPDHASDVIDSFKDIAYRFKGKTFYLCRQVHGVEIAEVSLNNACTGIQVAHELRILDHTTIPSLEQAALLPMEIKLLDGYDAVVTTDKDAVLMTFYADCTPMGFYDPVNKVIAMAHGGWQGTVLGIGMHMVSYLQEKHGTRPEELLAVIGPTAKGCCYEVDEPVRRAFLEAGHPFDLHAKEIKSDGNDGYVQKYMLDMAAMNKSMLIRSGLMPLNIHGGENCSICGTGIDEKSIWHSHRRDGNGSGRMTLLMSLD